MRPSDFRLFRELIGKTQAELAKELGLTTMTISHYERGFRHDDKRPVVIPKTVELACAALWLGIKEFDGTAVHSESYAGEEEASELLPPNKVPQHRVDHALRLLTRRGHDLGAHQFAFPLWAVAPLWGKINDWCRENLKHRYELHPVVRGLPGESVGVLAFESEMEAALFKTFWISN